MAISPKNKKKVIWIDGKSVKVNEKTFRDFRRGIWNEKKRRERRSLDTISFDQFTEEALYLINNDLFEENDPQVLFYKEELERETKKAMSQLEPLDQEIWWLFSVEEMPIAEIAKKVNVSRPTVYARIDSTRVFLQQKLKDFL